MQNVEHGQGDYVGLGEGEYVELLPGNTARERRDAHLNHCNRIQEYGGPVFELRTNRYGGELQHVGYFGTVEKMSAKLDARKAAHDKWIADCRAHGESHLRSAEAMESGTKSGFLTPVAHRLAATECFDVADKHEQGFRCDVVTVRQ